MQITLSGMVNGGYSEDFPGKLLLTSTMEMSRTALVEKVGGTFQAMWEDTS